MPAIPPKEAAAAAATGLGNRLDVSNSVMNSFRVTAAAMRLASYTQPVTPSESTEFFNLCLSLARGIDYAVANNDIPDKVQDLPSVFKKVCQHKNDPLLEAPITVLMFSVKTACKGGWFLDKESQELVTLANEMGSRFCSSGNINHRLNNSNETVSAIMSRFYPLMKMGQTLVSLEAKPGFGALMSDFHILKSTVHSPEEKIRLFVARTDNIETSACIISPKNVNFLINGTAVDKRTNVSMFNMGAKPQMPTDVTAMLKYGTNLLQALGCFDGHYIIIVAFMSMLGPPEATSLLDYVDSSAPNSEDLDVIEGPSQVSLNCPISRTRIKTPIKGHACKHLQCFDFNNYVGINSRSPSWRCPNCNQHVCYSEIRIDRNMVKVLEAVADDVSNVIISMDGAWKAVLEGDGHVDKPHDDSQLEKPVSIPNAAPMLLDLTQDDDERDTLGTMDEDWKPSMADIQSQSAAMNLSTTELNNAVETNQNIFSHMLDSYFSGFHSSYAPTTSSFRTGAQVVGSSMESIPSSSFVSPMSTDFVTPAFSRAEAHGNMVLTMPAIQSQFFAPSNMQLQQSQLMNSINHEYGMLQSIPRHVSREPIAVQALPAQPQAPKRPRTGLNTSTPNSSQAALSTAPTSSGLNTVSSDIDKQPQFSRSNSVASSSMQHHLVAQSLNQQGRSHIPGPSVQQVGRSHSPGQSVQQAGVHVAIQLSGVQTEQGGTKVAVGQAAATTRSTQPLSGVQTQQGGIKVAVGQAAATTRSIQPLSGVQTQQGGTKVAVDQAAATTRSTQPLSGVQTQLGGTKVAVGQAAATTRSTQPLSGVQTQQGGIKVAVGQAAATTRSTQPVSGIQTQQGGAKVAVGQAAATTRSTQPLSGVQTQQGGAKVAVGQAAATTRSTQPLSGVQTQQGVKKVAVGQAAATTRSTQPSGVQTQQGGTKVAVGQAAESIGSTQQARLLAAANRAIHMAVEPPLVAVQTQMPRKESLNSVSANRTRASAEAQRGNAIGLAEAASRAEVLADSPSDQTRHCVGRMRGSITGRACPAALSQYVIQPTQSFEAVGQHNNVTSPASVPTDLQAPKK